jgi:ElaB/YqjD/DUF883 family membrane-anchored ribosome-binding protein
MKNRTESTAHKPQELLDELRSLVTEAEKLMGDTAEQSEGAISALRSRFESAQERVAELYTGARKKVIDGAKYTDEAIRENPYQSLAIALGAGLLVGVLLGRRSR